MRRLSLLGPLVLGVSVASAQAPQSDDAETPPTAGTPSVNVQDDRPPRRNLNVGDEPSDTPPVEGQRAPARPPADGEDRTGDPPLRLTGRGDGANPEGSYAGVSLGGQGLPPKPPKLPVKGPQRMTWPGFQVRDGVPTVFLQTTGTPDFAVSEAHGSVVVTLRGTKIQLRNNQRPLKVAEFGTDVTEVIAKQRGRDAVVTIKRKAGAGHRERVEPSAGGYQLLVVELPGAPRAQ
jgi:hypothetical protein